MTYIDDIVSQLPPAGDFEDCYAFSVHKSGSSLLSAMIGEICQLEKIPAISIPDAIFKHGVLDKDWRYDKNIRQLFTRGRLYFGFRYMPECLSADYQPYAMKKSVLLVRDPRDALVSAYFSYGGRHMSHPLPDSNQAEFVKQFMSTTSLSLDDYVLQAAADLKSKLTAYKECLDFDRVLLLRYEDVFFDKLTSLRSIFNYFGINVAPQNLEYVASSNDIRPATEDPSKHIRKGYPGDYKTKLQPETIFKLNAFFTDITEFYGYQFDDDVL